MKIALAHDWLNQLGGAEDVLAHLHGFFPQAPILTSIYDRPRLPPSWQAWDIRSTGLDRLPGIHRNHQPYMPLFAWSWAHRTVPADYDVVLSNKSAFCLGIQPLNPSARHICYCLTPTRFTYDFEGYVGRGERLLAGAATLLKALNMYLRRWETRAAQRVHQFIAISREVQMRIRQLYNRDSVVIYPPVEMPIWQNEWASGAEEAFYLIVSRLLPYKRVDLAIEAFSQMGLPLVIAGDGRDRPRLEQLAARLKGQHPHANITFLGRVSDAALANLLARCKAFVFPGFEDFGIAPIRAMAYGKPVIALAKGGALDTVLPNRTGTLFAEPIVDYLIEAVQKNSEVTFAPVEIRRHAEQFGVARFQRELLEFMKVY